MKNKNNQKNKNCGNKNCGNKNCNDKENHGYNGGEEGLPIDFIFVNNKITDVSKYRILTTKYYKQYTSDHYPIYADMSF